MTRNDQAWQKYLKEKDIVLDGKSWFVIEAKELKSISGREPRLLAKFDTPADLPEPFKESGYTLLPIRNGQYWLGPGNLFFSIMSCTADPKVFEPSLSFPLETAKRGSSEAQYIDDAFNMGILQNFLNIPHIMYHTIGGREYTRAFEFTFSSFHIAVESVQIEVDSGYESFSEIVLIEAKIGMPRHFNLRQLYYPYRHFSSLVPTKRVRNVFLAYDLPSATYRLHEYEFLKLEDPLSLTEKKCAVYQVSEMTRLTVHDLWDARFQTRNNVVPQADDLNKVFELLSLATQGVNTSSEVADHFGFDQRQSSYYREAAEYLGLITKDYVPTELGFKLLSEPTNQKTQLLAKIVINSWIFVDLVTRVYDNTNGFTRDDVEAVVLSTGKYSGTTVGRRAKTIIAWVNWLSDKIGCFEVSDEDRFYLR